MMCATYFWFFITLTIKKRIEKITLSLIILYVIGGIVIYLIQDLLLFHPTPLPANHRFLFDQTYKEFNLTVDKNNVSIIQFRTLQRRKGIVLFFHGNMHHVEYYKKYIALFTRNMYDIWMIDYPGFGKTTGKRSEQILYKHALAFYDMAVKQVKSDSIVIYGKSIGTGIASFLASRKPSRRLILETPYYSIQSLAKHYFPIYPVLPATRYRFPIHTYLSDITVPLAIFHGTEDEVIPYSQSNRLALENPGIELISIPNGKHNNLFENELYQLKMDSLLGKNNY